MADTYYDSIQDMMYENAIHSLYNGMPVMPWEREVLAMAPLPEDIVDPFAAQDADPLQIMGLAYKSLVTWIEEARKANYFTKRFTDLSKLVLKGVNTMGRGLMTLHNRGEDLTQAPMQIGDLISVGSYHLRKSYLGVIQTASSHPEISERLLMNQLSWTNMLLRLYKTKEKLAKPVFNEEVRRKKEELSGQDKPLDIRNAKNALNEEETSAEKSLSDGKDDASSFLPLHSSFGEVSSLDEASSFSELDALFEPAALSAPRALSSFDKSGTERERLSPKPGASKYESGRLSPKEELSPGPGAQEKTTGLRTQEKNNGLGTQEKITEHISPEKSSENNTQKKLSETEPEILDAEMPSEPGVQEQNREDHTPEKDSDNKKPGKPADLPGPQDPTPDLDTDSCSDTSDLDPGLPPYLAVLKNIMERSGSEDDGALTFTGDEMCFLAADSDFNRIYPAAADHFRRILAQIDSG